MNMGRLIKVGIVTLVSVIGLTAGGCAESQRLSDVIEANRVLTDRNSQLTQENQGLSEANAALQARLDAATAAMNEQLAINSDLLEKLRAAGVSIDEMNTTLASMKFGPLDATTNEALEELARQYSDLIEYDAARGMLRFKSDLTFASGSDVVSSEARSGLTRLGEILKTPAAIGYDVKVLGHTDSQRLSAATREKFRTNLLLSAFRAVAVRNVLTEMGIAPERFEIAGRGEFDPVVPNTANGNTPQNRRVEIFLVRPTRRSDIPVTAAPESLSSPPTRSSAPARQDDFMK